MIASSVALLFLIIALIRTLWCNLSPVVKKTVSYIKHQIHILTYPPWKKEKANKDYRLEEVTRQLYEATKGVHVERDLLNKLNIPSLNLELYGCPKYDMLKEMIIEPLLTVVVVFI